MCLLFILSLNLGWSLQYLMYYLWPRCVCSARIQLRLFDFLSLEDVQYLSVQFPIILPVDRSNYFTTSESDNYHGLLPVHMLGNDSNPSEMLFLFIKQGFKRSLKRLTEFL